ncbi:SIMPL domain-containing protein [Gallaecimonas sp. GXIMD4217]|uniref:SIMPL domain-containing protein n=1 Tax=Gallaecimonas sp. GXIMD4217 TaxID=3131927 RepID=UPI00311AD7BB
MKTMTLALVALLGSPLALAADRYVSVQGEAVRAVAPDQVLVQVSFSAEGADAQVLLEQVESQARPFLTELKGLGIAERHIQGHRFEVYPRYEKGKTIGLRAQQRYSVTVEGFERYPKVLKAAVAAGASHVGQGQLQYSKKDELYLELLAQALVNARAKAKLLAKAGDASLGKVLSVDEQGGFQPPVMYMRAAAMEAKGSGPVQTAGEIEVKASVSARFELD